MRWRVHILVGAALVLAGGSVAASEEGPVALSKAPPAAGDTNWHATAGYVSAALGVVSLGVSAYYAQQINTTQDKVATIAVEAYTVTSIDEFDRLSARVDRLNRRGDRYETAHLSTLVGGIFLAAVGGGLLVWDLLDTPVASPAPPPEEGADAEPPANTDNIQLSVLPLPTGLSLRWTW